MKQCHSIDVFRFCGVFAIPRQTHEYNPRCRAVVCGTSLYQAYTVHSLELLKSNLHVLGFIYIYFPLRILTIQMKPKSHVILTPPLKNVIKIDDHDDGKHTSQPPTNRYEDAFHVRPE